MKLLILACVLFLLLIKTSESAVPPSPPVTLTPSRTMKATKVKPTKIFTEEPPANTNVLFLPMVVK